MKSKHHKLLRWPTRLSEFAAWAVLITFTANFVNPTIVSAKALDQQQKLAAAPERTKFDELSDTLIALEESVDRMHRRLAGQWEFEWEEIAHKNDQQLPPPAADRQQVKALYDQIEAESGKLEPLYGHARAWFAQTRKHIEDQRLAPEILDRHDASAAEFEQRTRELKDLLHAMKTAQDESGFKLAVAAAHDFFAQHSSKPLRAPFDPNAPLAFGPSKSKAREPMTDAKALAAKLAGTTATSKAAATPTVATTTAAPGPADLAATEDAPLTEAIRAKAAELGKNPVAIYNFVRNNVEFLPTYGSIQGADQTLKTLRGNAFDQSSLLIALLRASDIPARYVYGTVELPIDQVQNWVGGTTSPRAALELLGQGGIPNIGLTEAGVFKAARIEHVWVEAFVDFVPSRGAKHIAGDTWVPLDPSFKQYDYTAGMDLAGNVPFDAQGFADHLTSTATVNEAEGWVQGVDQSYVQQQLTDYGTRLTQYVESQDADATLGEVIGTKKIRAVTETYFAGTLPHVIKAVAQRYSALPSTLRWQFRFALDGQMLLSRSLPALAGKPMALSFKPATQADEDALKSLIPADADGPEDLPTSIPTSLMKLTAEYSVNDETVATGVTKQLGTELMTRKGLYIPGQGWQETDNPFTVGDYQAVGLDGAGLSLAELDAHKAALETTKAKLEAQNYAGLTKYDLTGSLLQTAVMSYFAQTLAKSKLAAQAGNAVTYRLPSYGTVATDSQVSYWFGIPRNFAPKGVLMDMDRVASTAISENGDVDKWKGFNQTIGSLLSAHEHSVLEELFDDRDLSTPKTDGISAVKALAIAAKQGQRIYTITQANLSSALSAISHTPEVEREIADAVMAGKQVTVHQSPTNYAGQLTAGYVISDESTGSAAYKIATGEDGGMFIFTFIVVAIGLVLAALALYAAIVTGAGLLVIGLSAWALIWMFDTAKDWADRMREANNSTEFSQAAFMAVVQTAFSVLSVLKIGAGVLGEGAFALMFGSFFTTIFECTWYDEELPWCLF